MEEPYKALPDELAKTLRGMMELPRILLNSQLARPALLARCQRIKLDRWDDIIYVDGFLSLCHANSWKVYSDARESGLSLWLGLSCAHARWVEHAWCMLGNRIIETTYARAIYYGAE